MRVPFRSREQRRGRHEESDFGGTDQMTKSPASPSIPEAATEAGAVNGDTPDSATTLLTPEGTKSQATVNTPQTTDSGEDSVGALLRPEGSPAVTSASIPTPEEAPVKDSTPSPLQLPELSESRKSKAGTRVMAVANQKGRRGKDDHSRQPGCQPR